MDLIALIAIHLLGLLAALVTAWRLSVPLGKAALIGFAFMAAGWALPWPIAILPDALWFWLVTSLAVSLVAATLAARILHVHTKPAAAIVLFCGLGMLVAAVVMRRLV